MIRTLDLPRGPIVGVYMQEQVQWMLRHPISSSSSASDGSAGSGAGGSNSSGLSPPSSYTKECELYLKGLRERELAAADKKEEKVDIVV